MTLTNKQQVAIDTINNHLINTVQFGGGIATGKSFLGAVWILTNAKNKKLTNYAILGTSFLTLRRTTMRTIIYVAEMMGINYTMISGPENAMILENGSKIIFAEVSENIMSYNRFDGIFIDQTEELSLEDYHMVRQRTNSLLTTFNKETNLPSDVTVRAYFSDNPYLSEILINVIEKFYA